MNWLAVRTNLKRFSGRTNCGAICDGQSGIVAFKRFPLCGSQPTYLAKEINDVRRWALCKRECCNFWPRSTSSADHIPGESSTWLLAIEAHNFTEMLRCWTLPLDRPIEGYINTGEVRHFTLSMRESEVPKSQSEP